MNKRSSLSIVIAAAVALPPMVGAQTAVSEEKTVTTNVSEDGRTTTSTKTTTTFTPEYKTKVVEYFKPYKARPYGLPPTVVEEIKVERVPKAWRTTTIERGYVIPKSERPYLAPAPSDLVAVLPAPAGSTKYYIMGRNVVAVDTAAMAVIDTIPVPTITYDDGETIIREGGKTTTIEEDGDIEVEVDDDDDDDDIDD